MWDRTGGQRVRGDQPAEGEAQDQQWLWMRQDLDRGIVPLYVFVRLADDILVANRLSDAEQ